MALENYTASTADWRRQLLINERKSRLVIYSYLFIYLLIGLIVDAFVVQHIYPQAPLSEIFKALVTFQITPIATLIMIAIGGISLFIAYSFYDRIMLLGTDSREITPSTAKDLKEKQLYHVVEEMKVAAGLQYMPKVFLIEAEYMNAFASGYSEKSAMVAITRGLLEKLDRAELQAVMAHELSHIRHHDIKLTMMVAVLSNILLIVIDVLFYSAVFGRGDRKQDNRLLTIIIILRYVLPLITVILALFLSRTREYMADAGSVELMRDNEPMARALLKISQDHEQNAEKYAKAYGETAHEEVRQASYLFDPSALDPVKSLSNMFSTHPAIEKRLAAIGFNRKK